MILKNGFVGEGAGSRDYTDVALLVNVAGRNADAAATGGVRSRTGSNDSGTIGADQAGFGSRHCASHANHVFDRDALGDADGQIEAGINAFKDGIGRKWRRHEYSGDRGARSRGSFGHGVEDRDLFARVFKDLATFARGDAGDDLGAVVNGELGMSAAEGAGDALDHDFGFGRDKNAHGDFAFVELRLLRRGLRHELDDFLGSVGHGIDGDEGET